jgi:hypothetical protein
MTLILVLGWQLRRPPALSPPPRKPPKARVRKARWECMIDLGNLEAWFVAGSQHLYGPETLRKVAEHAATIAGALAASPSIPVKIVCRPAMTSSESIHELCLEANRSRNCVGSDHLDAYLLAGPDVDCGPALAGSAAAAPAHAIQ